MPITRIIAPSVKEPPEGTWSNCLVVGGIAYVAGMTASGGDLSDEYTQSKSIFGKIKHLIEAAGGISRDYAPWQIPKPPLPKSFFPISPGQGRRLLWWP